MYENSQKSYKGDVKELLKDNDSLIDELTNIRPLYNKLKYKVKFFEKSLNPNHIITNVHQHKLELLTHTQIVQKSG